MGLEGVVVVEEEPLEVVGRVGVDTVVDILGTTLLTELDTIEFVEELEDTEVTLDEETEVLTMELLLTTLLLLFEAEFSLTPKTVQGCLDSDDASTLGVEDRRV